MLNTKRPLASLIKYGGSYGLLAGNLSAVILRTLRDLAVLVALATATNAVLEGRNVLGALVFTIIAMFINSPIVAFQNYIRNKYHLNFMKKLKSNLALNISGVPLSYIDEQDSGELISTYSADTEIVLNWIFRDLFGLVGIVLYLLGVFVYSMMQNALLTVIVFPVILVIAPLFSGLYKKMTEATRVQRESAAATLVKMQEVLNDPEFVKTYILEDEMNRRMLGALTQRNHAEKQSGIYEGMVMALGMLASYLPAFTAAAAGVYFLAMGMISAGFLVGFVQIVIQRLSGTVMEVNGIFSSTKRAEVSAKRVISLLNAPREREGGRLPNPDNNCAFSFENVYFNYKGGKEVIKNISFKINRGERIAFVGRSGCGKSTILKLMMGLYSVTGGRILFFGDDINEISPMSLRECIAPVFQDTSIFPFSIRENIGRATQNATDEDIMTAAEKAGLEEFIKSRPDGLDTEIGERGVNLSGGQRQRIAIARAFLADAPILLFDEPTSSLDAATELVFKSTLEKLSKGKTTITVAHRLNTISASDRIYVVDNNEIVQCGTHEKLIEEDGVYRNLYKEQLEGGASNVS